jgi:hypothetical protein
VRNFNPKNLPSLLEQIFWFKDACLAKAETAFAGVAW